MSKRVGIEVSLGVSEAVKLANADCIAAYPITPQTHIVEHLSEIVANGELDAEFIPVESEHSAMSVCCGCSATGARTYTATSSQGLALMNEIVFIVPSLRLPIVMTVADRSISGPISIWNDHTDAMSVRDCGWIQFFVENGQEAFDAHLQAFKIAEDKRVLLPVMVHMDGFILTHMIEPIEFLEKNEVERFLSDKYEPAIQLNPEKPVTMGPVGIPEVYTEAKKVQDYVLHQSKKVILEVWKEFGDMFGRYFNPVETYKVDDAEVVLLTMGSYGETASLAVDELRKEGKKAGLIKLRLWRPFPFEEFFSTISHIKGIGVVDRAITYGTTGGPVAIEIRNVLYDVENKPVVTDFIAGLAGRDVTINDFKYMYEQTEKAVNTGKALPYQFIGVRE
jgi:pyruvate ferredoxin oxidoreductase alpha subunit